MFWTNKWAESITKQSGTLANVNCQLAKVANLLMKGGHYIE